MLRKIARIIKRMVAILGIFGILMFSLFITAMAINYFKNKDNKSVNDYKSYYNVVKEALYNYDSSIDINIKNYNKNLYNLDVVNEILKDNPELKGNFTHYNMKVKNLMYTTRITINFKYIESKEVLQARENEVENKVKEIISKVIKPEMKDYEKEAVLHDYIASNAKYDNRFYSGDMPKESYTAYGVLINKVGVCLGYAQAMDKLLKASGIDSTIITGDADNGKEKGYESHAWNIVKIGGQYYHLDTTWDDLVNKDGRESIRHSYFNLSDEQIEKNHKWDKSKYTACNNTEYNFNNLNLVETDENGYHVVAVDNYEEFYSEIKRELSQGVSGTTFRIKNFDNNPDKIESSINRAYSNLSKSGRCSYTYYKDEVINCGYVKVSFQ